MAMSTTRRLAWREAARRVMTPLVRALLREGLRRADLLRLLEDVLGDAAVEEDAESGATLRRVAGSARIAGRGAATRASAEPALAYRDGVRLVDRWLVDAPWAQRGQPRTLPLKGAGSFAALAEAIQVDPEVALRELRRLGLLQVRGTRVSLRRNAYVPAGVIEKLDILGRDGAEFLRTVIHNIAHPPERNMLQRKASYDNIGQVALGGLQARLREEATRVLTGVNQTLARVDRDRNPAAPGGRRTRVSFGVYVFMEPSGGGHVAPRRKRRRPRRAS